MDLAAYFREAFGRPENLERRLADENLEVVALDSSVKIIGSTPEAKEDLLQWAEWAQALGVPGIRVFDGGRTRRGLSPADRAEAVDFLRWWQTERSRRNWTVELIVETHDALAIADACLELGEACEGDLHLLWDAHHTWRKGGEDPIETWNAIQPLVRHVHFKDSVGDAADGHSFSYTHLGQGEFPLQRLFDRLRQDRFAGPVSLEWERKWHPDLDPLDAALKRLDPFREAAD